MSWSFNVPVVAKDKWSEAVDAAKPGGQDANLPGMKEDVAAAKESLKALGLRVKRPFVAGSASGHCLQENQDSYSDSLTVSVYGSVKST